MKKLIYCRHLSFLLAIVLLFSGCSHTKQGTIKTERTCLVLSVGGIKGLAHLGAIDALKELNIKIDYVYGNSAGSLVGGLYSFDPQSDLLKESKILISEYIKRTENEKIDRARSGYLFGTFLSIITGGLLGWETIISSTFLSWQEVEIVDLNRIENILNKYFHNRNIEDLPVEFATAHQEKTNDGIEFNTTINGNLASAIRRSISNPFLFKSVIDEKKYFDPGSDRMAATPIYDAILQFNPTKVIALNVSGQPSIFPKSENVRIIEIMINAIDTPPNDVKGITQLMEKNYEIGYNTVMDNFLNE